MMTSRNRFLITLFALGLTLLTSLSGLACRPKTVAQRQIGLDAPPIEESAVVGVSPAAVSSPTPRDQSSTIRFERISAEAGLSQNVVRAIAQDWKGFMWFGTEGGLNRYDGYEFTVYKHDPDDPSTLSDDLVSTIYEDRSGDLWVGTRNGLNRFDRKMGTFARYQHDPNDPQSLGGKWVVAIFEDREGVLWVGTDDGGLDQLDRTADTFTHYRHDPDDPLTLSDNSVSAIYEDRSGMLWVGTDGGLNEFDRATGTFTRYQHDPDNPQSLSDDKVSAILEDREGRLWIGTEGGGLEWLDWTSKAFIHHRHNPDDTQGLQHSLSHDRVRAVFEDSTGRLWIGTQNGLDLYDRQGDRFVHYWHDPSDLYSLSSNAVWSIHEDRTGMLWFGTYGGGLSKHNPMTEQFALFQHHADLPNSLSDNMVWSIFEDRSEILWIGTFNGGLNRLDRAPNTFSVYRHDPEDPASLSSDDVRAILEDRTGTLWVGTAGGLEQFDRQAKTFTHYRHDPKDPSSLSENRVTVLYEDREANLWVGTRAGGLNRFDRTTDTFVRYQHDPNDASSLSDDRVWALYEDRSGNLWVGTLGGINLWDPDSNRFTHYVHDPDDAQSLSNDQAFSFYEDPTGAIWIGTWGSGLDRFDPATQTFAHYTEKHGLPDNVIYGIEVDSVGFLWMSTNKGLSRFDPRTETFQNYDVHDGLQHNEFNVGAHSRSDSGEMFFGGIRGFNAFYPEQVKPNPHIPPIVITSFSKFNEKARADLLADEHIQLSYQDDFIAFEFAALDYTAPDKNQYAYMLEGQDQDWVDAGTRRYASYTNLKGGDYVFRVKGSNNDGVWNEEGAVVYLTITPPVWETWWFRGGVAFVLVGVVASGYWLRVRNVEARSRELERQVKERTVEIERRTQELEALNAIAAVVSRSLDLQEMLNNALDKTLEVTGLEAGGVYLFQEDDEVLIITAHRGLSAPFLAEINYLQIGEGFSGRVLQTGEPLVVQDLSTDPRLTRSTVREEGFKVVAIAPLVSRGRVLGTLFVISRERQEFSPQDVDLLTAIGHQIGVAIENARLFEAELRRAEQFQVISEVGHRITSILAIDELLEEMTRLIKETLGYYLVGIGLVEGNELVFKAGAGAIWEVPGFEPPRLKVGQEGITGWVAQRGEPLLVPDLSQEPRHYGLPQASEMQSELAVPLRTKERVIGVLHAQSDRPNAFDESDLVVLQSLADQAAIAIDNAWLFAEARLHADELAVLNDLGQALTARLNVEQVLDEAYWGVSRLLDATSFYIALYDPEKDEVTFAIDVREGELRKPYSTRKAGQGLTEYVIRNRTPLLIRENLLQRLEKLGIEAIGPVALSWLGVPLMIEDRVLGVMAIQSYATSRAYDEHDRDLLTAIASQAAIAIHTAHLFEETSSRAERLAVVNRIASAASATLRLGELMETVYREIAPAFQADAFFIALYDQKADELDFCFRVDEGIRQPPERLPLGVGLASLVVTEKKPVVIRDEQERDRLAPSPHLFGTMKPAESWLGAPMLVGERVIGVISVQAYRPHAWGEEDELLLLTITDQIAVALENARLFAEVERRVQELEALYHADEHLYRYLHLDQVLQALVDVAVDILQADKSSLMVWDEQRENLVVRASRGFSAETLAQMTFAPGEGMVGIVATTGEPTVVPDTHTDTRVATRVTEPEGIRSFLHMPIKIGGQVFGVFNVDYAQPRAFGDDEQRLFTALAQRAALAIQNAQLYEHSQELAVVEERQRLARDLHDAVTQTLFSASLIAEVLPILWERNPAEGRKRLEELRELTRGALAEMRTLLLELRPAALVEANLGDLLRQLAESITGRARVPVAVELEGKCVLSPEVKVALYRVAQEALNNVAKHSGASQASVSLHCEPGLVALNIRDDGRGFVPEDISPDSLGLGIMRERIEAIGATLEIETQIGHGTQVTVIWTDASG